MLRRRLDEKARVRGLIRVILQFASLQRRTQPCRIRNSSSLTEYDKYSRKEKHIGR